MASSGKIQTTRDYSLFKRTGENRTLKPEEHKKLLRSMKKYGFLHCFPIVCVRDKKGNLLVKEGQHRLLFAETLGLPVHWVEEPVDFDVAEVNCTAKPWTVRDFAERWSADGISDYQKCLDFSDAHRLPVGTAAALLAGCTSFSKIKEQFISGTYKAKDVAWANAVASIYVAIVSMNKALRNARFIAACMGACRIKNFDIARMVQCAERCREKLVPYSTRDAYLGMLEEIYNFGRSKTIALKHDATVAMRERNPAHRGKRQRVIAAGAN